MKLIGVEVDDLNIQEIIDISIPKLKCIVCTKKIAVAVVVFDNNYMTMRLPVCAGCLARIKLMKGGS